MPLRHAQPEDVEAVIAVITRARRTMEYLPQLHTHEEHLGYFGRMIREHEAWVAEEDGRVLGVAVLSESMLEHLYVDPDAQSRGLGGQFMARARERRQRMRGLSHANHYLHGRRSTARSQPARAQAGSVCKVGDAERLQ